MQDGVREERDGRRVRKKEVPVMMVEVEKLVTVKDDWAFNRRRRTERQVRV